jgi:hypothetical protein
VAPRGRSLNVYWEGQSIFNVSCPAGDLRVTTHEKYLVDPALAGQVPLMPDGTFNTAELAERALVRRYAGPDTLKKLKAAASLFAGNEKRGCHAIAVRNPSVLDVEIAFPGKHTSANGDVTNSPRVDFAAVEPDGADVQLVFWEAKTYDNGELRAFADGPAPVCGQIDVYRNVLQAQREAVEVSYTAVAANLVSFKSMGWKRELSPLIEAVGTGNAKLHLGREPQVNLVVFGFDAGQRQEKRWQSHLGKLKERIGKVLPVGDPKQISL